MQDMSRGLHEESNVFIYIISNFLTKKLVWDLFHAAACLSTAYHSYTPSRTSLEQAEPALPLSIIEEKEAQAGLVNNRLKRDGP